MPKLDVAGLTGLPRRRAPKGDIEIGKEVFHFVGFGTDGKIGFRRK